MNENKVAESIKMQKIQFFKNGSKIKPVKNKSVLVVALKQEIEDDVIIEFRKMVEDPAELGQSPAVFEVLRNKAHSAGYRISRKSALALYAGLHDYFTRVDKILGNYIPIVRN